MRPLVLMSGGVGLTPMMSMLETAIKNQPKREIIFIHAAQNGRVHAMKERVKEITENHNITSFTIYDSPEQQDEGAFDKEGYIDAEWLSSVLPTHRSEERRVGKERETQCG